MANLYNPGQGSIDGDIDKKLAVFGQALAVVRFFGVSNRASGIHKFGLGARSLSVRIQGVPFLLGSGSSGFRS